MNDDSYHMPRWIGIGIRISIGKIFSSILGIKVHSAIYVLQLNIRN